MMANGFVLLEKIEFSLRCQVYMLFLVLLFRRKGWPGFAFSKRQILVTAFETLSSTKLFELPGVD